jgi:hypothetical protein
METYLLYYPNAKQWLYFELDPFGERIGSPGEGTSPEAAIEDFAENLDEKIRIQRTLFLDSVVMRH